MAADPPRPTPAQPRWAQTLTQAWLRRGGLAHALLPLAWVYGGLWALRAWLFRRGWLRSTRLPLPVVVIGNVVVGGAGKTPTVIALARHWQAQGWKPGVISRGHGGRHAAPTPVRPDSDPAEVGDEPALIARATGVPVMVGRHRVAAARALMAAHPEVNLILSDDGMQHWALQRDATVVVFDARGVGNGWLLPAGLLREPWPAAIWGNGPLFVLHTQPASIPPHPAAAQPFRAHRRLAAQAVNAQGATCPLTALRERPRLAALAGIAQPQVFFQMLRACGLPLRHTLALPDHADTPTLLAALASAGPDLTWLCTEKDAVKLFAALRQSGRSAADVWAVGLEQDLEPALLDALDRTLAECKGLSSPHGHQTP